MISDQRVAVDTSVAVPLLVASHEAHNAVCAWTRRRPLWLSGQALVETYSVLTRLPGDARLTPADAALLIDDAFAGCLALPEKSSGEVHRELARSGIAGGAVYDGLVAYAALLSHATLATRDGRARPTYERVGVVVEVVAAHPEHIVEALETGEL